MTDRISLDFIQVRRWPWFGLLFLLLGCSLAAVVSFQWTAARQSNAVLEESIARKDAALRAQRLARLAAQKQPDPRAQLRQRSETVIATQLDYPWDRVMGDIEQASANNVALLALTHDQSGCEVQLSVEARALPEMMGMIDRLNGDAALGWYLANYQVRPQNNPPTIRGEIMKKCTLSNAE
jgi:hypothetical protein